MAGTFQFCQGCSNITAAIWCMVTKPYAPAREWEGGLVVAGIKFRTMKEGEGFVFGKTTRSFAGKC